jgi:transposase, IS6 family
VDSEGAATLDFYLSENHDAAAAKRFFLRVLAAANHPLPRVINVDGNPSYPKVVQELKRERRLGRRWRCRTCPYLNNIIEQDHRAVKRRIHAKQRFRSLQGACRTISGYE